MLVSLECPECGYCKVYDIRGYCRCGAYLIDGRYFRGSFLATGQDKNRVYWLDDNKEWNKVEFN